MRSLPVTDVTAPVRPGLRGVTDDGCRPSRWTPTVITNGRMPTLPELIHEGEYWTILFGQRELRFRDSKGMRYLAQLLAHPGREIEALLLATSRSSERCAASDAAEAGLTSSAESDLGPVLDATAKRAYRERLHALQTEIDRAEAFNHMHRAAKARIEWEAIVDQLRAATGLGGRDRRVGSPAERARLNVTRAIRGAISRITVQDPSLGEHLSACVHTGKTCVYRSDSAGPVERGLTFRALQRLESTPSPAVGSRQSTRVRIAYSQRVRWTISAGVCSSVDAAV